MPEYFRNGALLGRGLHGPSLNATGGGFAFHFRYRAAATDLRYIVQRNPDEQPRRLD